MSGYLDVAALAKILAVSLVAGVGLVSLFGVALVGLTHHQDRSGSRAWLLLSGACFAVVLAGAALGVYEIAS